MMELSRLAIELEMELARLKTENLRLQNLIAEKGLTTGLVPKNCCYRYSSRDGNCPAHGAPMTDRNEGAE